MTESEDMVETPGIDMLQATVPELVLVGSALHKGRVTPYCDKTRGHRNQCCYLLRPFAEWQHMKRETGSKCRGQAVSIPTFMTILQTSDEISIIFA